MCLLSDALADRDKWSQHCKELEKEMRKLRAENAALRRVVKMAVDVVEMWDANYDDDTELDVYERRLKAACANFRGNAALDAGKGE